MWLSQFHVVFSAIRFLPRSSMSSICPTSVRTRKVTTMVHLRRTMHDTPQEQPPRSLLKWKGVDQDGQSWVAIAICLSHTHARTLYTHARTHALTPRTHMHASCMHAHRTHPHTHPRSPHPRFDKYKLPCRRLRRTAGCPLLWALGPAYMYHATCRIRCTEVCAEAGNWGCASVR